MTERTATPPQTHDPDPSVLRLSDGLGILRKRYRVHPHSQATLNKKTFSTGDKNRPRTRILQQGKKRMPATESYHLETAIFDAACAALDYRPTHDAFASVWNKQCAGHWDEDTDAFAQDWGAVDGRRLYCNPPFSMVGRVVDKLVADRARVMLVFPLWTNAPWWLRLQPLIAAAVILPPRAYVSREGALMPAARWASMAAVVHPEPPAERARLEFLPIPERRRSRGHGRRRCMPAKLAAVLATRTEAEQAAFAGQLRSALGLAADGVWAGAVVTGQALADCALTWADLDAVCGRGSCAVDGDTRVPPPTLLAVLRALLGRAGLRLAHRTKSHDVRDFVVVQKS